MSTPPEASIRSARAADMSAVLALLRSAHLPTDDFSETAIQIWVVEVEGAVAGAVALEGHDTDGRLLRSLVVAPASRRRGYAQRLVAQLEMRARSEGIRQLVLLTETAQTFFERLGYTVIERSTVPRSLQGSAEFRSLCPATAVCMAKDLRLQRG